MKQPWDSQEWRDGYNAGFAAGQAAAQARPADLVPQVAPPTILPTYPWWQILPDGVWGGLGPFPGSIVTTICGVTA